MAYDYSKLKGKIKEVCSTQYAFAEKMGISERTLSLKLSGKVDWKQKDIIKAMDILRISKDEVEQYFFKTKVQNI